MNRACRTASFSGLLLLAACGSNKEAPMDSSSDCRAPAPLNIQPQSLGRGAPAEITIVWQVALPTGSGATALLSAPSGGASTVEVEVPLLWQEAVGYVAALTNPFGPGSPPGSVEVLAQESGSRCGAAPSAATAFTLE